MNGDGQFGGSRKSRIFTPRKPLSTEADSGFRGVTISHVLSRAVNNYHVILKVYSYTSSTLRMVSKQSRSYSVYSNAQTTPVRIYGEPYTHKFCAVDNPSSSNINRCQVPSRVIATKHISTDSFLIFIG